MKILVLAAHPDDEVLGMGGTIKKLANLKNKIHLCVISEGASAQYRDKKMIKVRKDACINSGKILGISSFSFLGFPDAKLDSIPQVEINVQIEKIVSEFKPDIVYTVSAGDGSKDHEKVFESTIVSCRSFKTKITKVISYELPGPRINPFEPNIYEDITSEIIFKNKAFSKYDSEIEKYPHPRSCESIESMAKYRGTQAGVNYAESFQLIYEINSKKKL